MNPNLNDELKNTLVDFCKNMSEFILKNHHGAKSIIVQLNENKIYIGSNIRGTFKSIYYSELNLPDDKNFCDYIKQNKKIIFDIFEDIKKNNAGSKHRSYIIIYNTKKNTINICTNSIGNKSIYDSRFYQEINFVKN